MQEADGALRVSRRLENRLFVVGHCALRCHSERVGLDLHVGRELPLALGGAVIANRAIEGIVGRLGGGVARLGHGAGVELSSAVRRSDKGPDDALQMDLDGLLAQAFGEALGSVDDQPFMKAADAIAVDDCCPKLSAIFNAWVAWGQERRTIARVVPRRGCDDLVLAIRFGPDISSRPREDDMAKPGMPTETGQV